MQAASATTPTLSASLQNAVDTGFTAKYKVITSGLTLEDEQIIYSPREVKIVNYYQFEGVDDPEDRSILFLLETVDGNKGTLLDAYGTYADPVISEFIKQVEEIDNKVIR